MKCFYHPDYFLPLPVGHPFPMGKFQESAQLIKEELPDVEMVLPEMVHYGLLAKVHSREYLGKVEKGTLSGDELYRLGLPWSDRLFRRSWLEASSTVRAAEAALQEGVACNLGGGTHHAFADFGLGYCVLNDVAVAIRHLQETTSLKRFMVIDTDAHQGNGTASLLNNDPSVFTYSIHGGRNYPVEKILGSMDVPLPRFVSGENYLEALKQSLPDAIFKFRPEMVFWNSGADVHEDDLFGQIRLKTEEMALRDELVLEWLRAINVPLAVVYGGGYNKVPGFTARLHANTIMAVSRLYATENVR